MAIQAPPHVEWLCLPRDRHLIDAAVATHATDAFLYMDTVIKIDDLSLAGTKAVFRLSSVTALD